MQNLGPNFGPGSRREAKKQAGKPGLQEALQLLAMFGPMAQNEKAIGAEKLRQLASQREFAENKGYPTLDAMSLDQQTQMKDADLQRRATSEQRLTEAEQRQTKLQEDAQFLDVAKLIADEERLRMPGQAPNPLLDLIKKRFNFNANPTMPDPLLKYK